MINPYVSGITNWRNFPTAFEYTDDDWFIWGGRTNYVEGKEKIRIYVDQTDSLEEFGFMNVFTPDTPCK
jgi:hypothetical protein